MNACVSGVSSRPKRPQRDKLLSQLTFRPRKGPLDDVQAHRCCHKQRGRRHQHALRSSDDIIDTSGYGAYFGFGTQHELHLPGQVTLRRFFSRLNRLEELLSHGSGFGHANIPRCAGHLLEFGLFLRCERVDLNLLSLEVLK